MSGGVLLAALGSAVLAFTGAGGIYVSSAMARRPGRASSDRAVSAVFAVSVLLLACSGTALAWAVSR